MQNATAYWNAKWPESATILHSAWILLNAQYKYKQNNEWKRERTGERGRGSDSWHNKQFWLSMQFLFFCFAQFSISQFKWKKAERWEAAGEGETGEEGCVGALALTQSTAKCRCHAMKQTNKSSVRPTAEAAAAAEKYATISHISAAAALPATVCRVCVCPMCVLCNINKNCLLQLLAICFREQKPFRHIFYISPRRQLHFHFHCKNFSGLYCVLTWTSVAVTVWRRRRRH